MTEFPPLEFIDRSSYSSSDPLPVSIGRLTSSFSEGLSTEDLVFRLRNAVESEGRRREWEAEIVSELSKTTRTNLHLPVIDLFSGCGGLSLGFSLAGFKTLGAYDSWAPAVETYNRNLAFDSTSAHAHLLNLDDLTQTIDELEQYRLPDGSFPGIIGGPPCQDFSSAGNRIEGSRADLTEKFASLVAHFRPTFVLMENVPTALKAVAYQNALGLMQKSGYHTVPMVVNASEHGAPQNRRRLFAFGSRDLSLTTHVAEYWNAHKKQRTTLRDWFGDKGIDQYFYRHPRTYSRRGIFSADELSPTIRGVNRPMSKTYPGHPGNVVNHKEYGAPIRPLSTSQRAQIQTFPEGFDFVGSKSDAEQMIGNAVPVILSKFIAEGIASATRVRS